jgi:uncharacterized protein (TIGR03000 family)
MLTRRRSLWLRATLTAAALLVPVSAQAQVMWMMPSGGFGRPGYVPPQFGQYGSYPSTFAGYGSGGFYGQGLYGTYVGGVNYGTYVGGNPGYGTYVGMNAGYGSYTGLNNYGAYTGGAGFGGSQSSFSPGSGDPITGQPGFSPRFRNTYTGQQAGQTPYYGTGPSSLGSSFSSSQTPRMRQGGSFGTSGTSGTTGTADKSAAVAYATLVCGCLNFTPAPYVPASYASVAAVAIDTPARMREKAYVGLDVAPVEPAAFARAEVEVFLPNPDAEVWFEGVKMLPIGSKRTFYTPPLERGGRYAYEVRARWLENGEPRTATREVEVRAGGSAAVDFTRAARKTP